jgi:hypothetical protein
MMHGTDYFRKSNSLFDYIKNQVTTFGTWSDVSGLLDKLSSSAAGYIWGFSRGHGIWMCREPCNDGSWKRMYTVEMPGTVLDLATDSQYAYVLVDNQGKKNFGRKNIDGSGQWEVFDAPNDANNLNVTDSFLFFGKQACAKPCTTANWVDIPTSPTSGGNDQGIISASPASVYSSKFMDGVYHIYKGTGTGQGGWIELPGLKNKSILATSIDNRAMYVKPTNSDVLERCEYPYDSESNCKRVDTNGRTATSVTVNPSTTRVWMTTKEHGPSGNIFQRLDEEDPSVIVNEVAAQEQDLERDVNSLGGEIRATHAEVTAGKVRKEASDIIRGATNLTGNISDVFEESDKLRSQIMQSKKQTAGYKNKLLPLQILTFTLAGVFLIYLVAGFILPSTVTSILAVLGLTGGLAAAIYFAVVTR